MTMMAEFLLQPAAPKGNERATSRNTDFAANTRLPSSSGQDFSRMLVQQRQAADIKPQEAPRAKSEPPRQVDHQRTEVRREKEPVRQGERT